MRIKTIDIDLDAVDDDGVAQAQTPGAAGNLTLNGALGTTLDYARILVITTASDESGKTLTFTGTDADGNTITEVVTGPNATTGVTTKLYKTVTSIAVSAAFTGTVKIGTVATTKVAASRTIPVSYLDEVAPTVAVDISGTISFTVQERFDNVLADGSSVDLWQNITALAAKSADTTAQVTRGATAVRVLVNSYSSGAELQARIVSADC